MRFVTLLSLAVTMWICVGTAAADTNPPVFTPTDPLYAGNNATSADFTNLPAAWMITQGSPSITIAVIGSGVNADPDFGSNLLPGFCDAFTEGCSSPTDTVDLNGHDTDMASIAAAGIDNGLGIAGVCGQCHILPIRISGADDLYWNSDLAAAINQAVAAKVNIINLSLQAAPGSMPDSGVNTAITNAINSGISVVIAAGNDGSSDPAANVLASANPLAIRVANIDPQDGQLMADSNRGSWTDIAISGAFTGDGIDPAAHGTSTSTAVGSGILGLMLECNGSLTPAQQKSDLIAGGTPVASLNVASGKTANAYGADLAAGCMPFMTPPPPPPPSTGGGGGNPPTPAPPATTTPAPPAATPTPTAPTMPTATSGPPKRVRLTVKVIGGGYVTKTPPHGDGYVAGTVVHVVAHVKAGLKFRGWGGICSGIKSTTCTFTIHHASKAVVVFVKAKHNKKHK